MARKLKAMGLALVAISALGALYASTASAQQGVLTSDGLVTLTGEAVGGETANRLTAFGGFFQCPGSTYTGHKYTVTPHEAVPAESTTATLTPHYKQVTAEGKPNCMAPFGWTATIHMNGCDYVLHIGAATGAEHTYAATFDIVCPEGNEITITLWRNGTSHETAPFCVLHIPEQSSLKGVHATDVDTNDGHIELIGTLEGLKVSRTTQEGPHHNAVLCPNTETSTAKLDLNITVKGHNEAGESTGVKLSHGTC